MQKFYSISEAAQLLGISAKTLRRWDKAGKVEIKRTPNGDRIFTLEDIEKLREKVSPFAIQSSAPVEQSNFIRPSLSAPNINPNKRFLIAGILVLIIALVYSNFILALNLKQDNKVLGIETFVAPVVSEEGPLGGVFSQAGRIVGGLTGIFKGGSLVVPLLGKSELETPADLNVQGKAHVASDIEGLGNLKIQGIASVGKLVTPVVDPYLIENDGTVQSTLEIRSTGDIKLESGSSNVDLGGSSLSHVSNITTGGETIGGNLSLSSTSPVISIGDTGTLKITDGTNTLLTLSDGGTIGNLKVTGTIEGSNISSGAKVSGTNTGDQTITLTGDVTGSGTGSFATTLGTSGVTAASYGSTTAIPVLTVDSKGRITAATTAAISSSWSSITDPTTNLSLTMGANTTTFTYNAATSTNNLFKLVDTTNNTGPGYLLTVGTASGSSLKPFQVQALGSSIIDTTAAGILTLGNSTLAQNVQFFSSSNTLTSGGNLTLAGYGSFTTANLAVATAGMVRLPNTVGSVAFLNNAGSFNGDWGLSTSDVMTYRYGGTTLFEISSAGVTTLHNNLLFTADNTYDIGASAANRPRNIYPGTSVLLPDGSAAAPSLAFSGDTTSGIFRLPGSGVVLGLSAGGTGRWFLDSSGTFKGYVDNTYDIGQSGANRPRSLYLGTSAILGTTPATAGTISIPYGGTIGARNAANTANGLFGYGAASTSRGSQTNVWRMQRASDGTMAIAFSAGDDGTVTGIGQVIDADANCGYLALYDTGSVSQFQATTGGNTCTAGVTVGNPTGGFKGTGTINLAGDIYKNNTAYTNPDYAFESFYTGKIVKFINNPGASTYTGLMNLGDVENFAKTNFELPRIASASGIFQRGDVILEKMEEAYLYLFNHEHRIVNLENTTSNLLTVVGLPQPSASPAPTPTPTPSPTPIPTASILSRIDSLETLTKNLELATSSAVLSASSSASFDNLTVTKKLLTLDLGITGKTTQGLLSINGLDNTVASGSATINTISNDLYLQNLGVGGVNFLNGKVVIDKNGNIAIQNILTAKKYNVDTTDSASSSIGSGIITAGTTSITITTSAVTDISKVFVTPVSDTDKPLIVKNKVTGKSFDVTILTPYSGDIHFDWFIVN